MSYMLTIIVPALPDEKALAWGEAHRLCSEENDDAPKAPVLIDLYKILVSVYPCMSSYRIDDPAIDKCPWSDGPLINNFGSATAVLGLATSKDRYDLKSLIVSAGRALGLTVLDEQSDEIHRPHVHAPGKTYGIFIHGIDRDFKPDDVLADVGKLFKVDRARMVKIFTTPAYKVKSGLDYLTALRYYHTLLKLGCRCGIGPEQRLD